MGWAGGRAGVEHHQTVRVWWGLWVDAPPALGIEPIGHLAVRWLVWGGSEGVAGLAVTAVAGLWVATGSPARPIHRLV